MPQGNLSAMRATYNEILNTNITSVALMTETLVPLLYKSADPKVINVSSGLGSIQNSLTKKMGRSPPYGASKIGLNGLTVHMQVAENDRVEAQGEAEKPLIRYYVCAPGPLKTAFTNYYPKGRSPEDGAEVIVHLLEDDDHKYEGGSYWEFEDQKMKQVPW
jgi:NAD(P)-dependent dehydrogenase (short-subunit alcohol dehydrogenase family)